MSARVRGGVPFALATALPFVALALPGPDPDVELMLLAALLSAVVAALFLFVPWRDHADWWALVPALGYLGVVALLREAGGGNASGFGPMALLPVVWIALYGSGRTLAITAAGTLAVYGLPILVDDVRYPSSGWRIGMLFAVLGALLGFAVLRLTERVRGQAARLERLAYVYELTALPNRRAWDQALETAIAIPEGPAGSTSRSPTRSWRWRSTGGPGTWRSTGSVPIGTRATPWSAHAGISCGSPGTTW